MNELISTPTATTERSTQYLAACRLHAEIMASGEIAATALVTLMKDLKQMRDDGLYEELGYKSFDDYVEQAVGIKKRQAYNYISSYERLGTRLLQSTAQFGITKLEIIASVPVTERDQFVEGNNIAEMSVRELKEAAEKIKEQGEQISFLQAELEEKKEETETLAKLKSELEVMRSKEVEAASKSIQIAKLSRELEEIKNRPIEVAVQQPDPAELAKVKEQAERDTKKTMLAEMAAKVEKAKQQTEKEYKDKLALADRERTKAEQRIAELEKKASTAGKPEKEIFKIYFDDLQADLKRILDFIATLDNAESQQAYRTAIVKYIDMIKANID